MTLPPLPEPWIVGGVLHAPIEGTFTAGQMRGYATAAVLAEREACAVLAEDFDYIAAAIRARSEP